jgi:dolichyl-phosphate-mannose-protein mannosyltransferase
MFTFYLQFQALSNHNNAAEVMSMEYQNTLNGNPFEGFTKEIAYGSDVYINHYNTRGGFLHSHASNYPGGTKQQQITLYPFRDLNNWWTIKHPLTSEGKVNETVPEGIIHIKNGDLIRLQHNSTGKRLHSHNERPGTTDKDYINEVTGYGFENFDGDSNDHWQVEIVEGDSRDPKSSEIVQAVYTKFRLRHPGTGCYLYSKNKKLPDWGFGQAEVLCMRDPKVPKTIWYIEKNEHKNIPESADPKDIVTYGKSGFLSKFFELNARMWTSNNDLTSSHPFDSRPSAWPVLKRGISFWSMDNKQVYLIGNIFIWYLASASVFIFFGIQAILVILEKREIRTVSHELQDYYFNLGGFLVSGWLLHYVPFFLMKRQLFLHHYFPALYFSILMFAFTFDTATKKLSAQTRMGLVILLSLIAIFVFLKFSPIAYGLTWTKAKCKAAQYLSNWDFDCNRPLN